MTSSLPLFLNQWSIKEVFDGLGGEPDDATKSQNQFLLSVAKTKKSLFSAKKSLVQIFFQDVRAFSEQCKEDQDSILAGHSVEARFKPMTSFL